MPEQPPPVQPLNIDPAAAVAVSVTRVPASNEVVQLVPGPQLIPAGEEVTVPFPLPPELTNNVTCGVGADEVVGSDDAEVGVGSDDDGCGLAAVSSSGVASRRNAAVTFWLEVSGT